MLWTRAEEGQWMYWTKDDEAEAARQEEKIKTKEDSWMCEGAHADGLSNTKGCKAPWQPLNVCVCVWWWGWRNDDTPAAQHKDPKAMSVFYKQYFRVIFPIKLPTLLTFQFPHCCQSHKLFVFLICHDLFTSSVLFCFYRHTNYSTSAETKNFEIKLHAIHADAFLDKQNKSMDKKRGEEKK